MQEDNITITLDRKEALLLFDFLSRFNERTNTQDYEYKSDQTVLWNFEAILEAHLSEVFQPNYIEIIDKARKAFDNNNA
jgi:hypothetical protein